MRSVYIFIFIALFGAQAYSESLESLLTKQRRELHEARRKLGLMKEKCYQTYPQFFKSEHADYDKNLQCLEEIQKKDQTLRERHNKELCTQFNFGCTEK